MNIKVLAGDFREGSGHKFKPKGLISGPQLTMFVKGKFLPEIVPLAEIQEIEVASEESVKRMGGAIGWGVAGAVLLGPLGLVAGLFGGGKGSEVTFVCQLKDERKFMATMKAKEYKALSAANF